MICRDTPPTQPPMGGCVGGWVGQWVRSVQMTNNWINLHLIDILFEDSILFEDLWFVDTPPPMGGCVGGWVGQWVNGWGQVKWLTIE